MNLRSGRCGYGLVTGQELGLIVRAVCDVLGHGANNTATDMLLETAAVETHSGELEDRHSLRAGVGVFQMDRIAFRDVQDRVRDEDVRMVGVNFGIDLRVVQYEFLAFSPLLAAVYCRLFYKLVPESFPCDIFGRACYWKMHYNKTGAGTVDHFLRTVEMWKR